MSSYIYHGPWINWEVGLIRGATITIGERNGGLLTAFIATFVTIVGAELWKIIRYALHQFRSRKRPSDGLYHQQQVILRNSATPGGASWLFIQQLFNWNGKVRWAFLRSLPYALFAIAYIVLVGLAAVFSSEISKSPGPHRLILSDSCGNWMTNASSPDRLVAYQTKSANDSLAAASYAKACYGGNFDPRLCNTFPVSAISWTADQNATCPFKAGMCLMGNTAAYQMTSQRINSHRHLGINSPPKSRVEFEKTTTCAPLTYRNFTKIVNATLDPNSLGRPGDTIIEFYMGEIVGVTNRTFAYNDHAAMDSIGYTLDVQASNAATTISTGSFVPIPEIDSSVADVTLMFIAPNSITYGQACYDPIFPATTFVNTTSLGQKVQYYDTDRYVSVLGCTEQYRVCNPMTDKCTDKLGLMQLQQTFLEDDDHLAFNALQNATASRALLALQVSSIYYATFTRLGGALRATESLHGLAQQYLPSTQWHIESGSWFDQGLARLQQRLQEYATGPNSIPSGSYLVRPNPKLYPGDAPWLDMCYSQFVNDTTDTTSFSVVGLTVLFGLGIIIIVSSLLIDTIGGWIQTRFNVGLHAWAEWQVNDKMQMQRLLHEATGLGHWKDGWFSTVPVTANGDVFPGPGERHLRRRTTEMNDGRGAAVELVNEHFDDKNDGRYH